MADLVKYKVQCIICGRILIVPKIDSPVPKHPEKGESVTPYVPYIPCPGSGQKGLFIDIYLPNI